jgi:hypothetical protein
METTSGTIGPVVVGKMSGPELREINLPRSFDKYTKSASSCMLRLFEEQKGVVSVIHS